MVRGRCMNDGQLEEKAVADSLVCKESRMRDDGTGQLREEAPNLMQRFRTFLSVRSVRSSLTVSRYTSIILLTPWRDTRRLALEPLSFSSMAYRPPPSLASSVPGSSSSSSGMQPSSAQQPSSWQQAPVQYGAGQNPPFVAQQEEQRRRQQAMYEQQRLQQLQQQHAAYQPQSQSGGSRVQPGASSSSSQPAAQSAGQQQQQQAGGQQQQQPPKPYPIPTDYVYFERSPHGFRKDTLEKAQAAKLKLEHFYQKAVQEAIERNGR